MGYSGARGTLIYEKNLKAKISCQTPFKSVYLVLFNRRLHKCSKEYLFSDTNNLKKVLKVVGNEK